MAKWCARLVQMFILLSLLVFLSIIALITLIDPNQFRETIQKQFSNGSERTLILKGPIRWHLSDGLGIEVFDVTLHNRSGFDKEFLKLKKARFTTHLWALITGRILTDVKLFDGDISLSRKSTSYNNWQDLFDTKKNTKNYLASKIILNAVQFSNINVDWQDDVLKRHYQFKHIFLNSGSLLQALKGNYSNARLEFHLKESTQEKTIHSTLLASWKLSNALKSLELQNIKISAEMKEVSPLLLALKTVKIQGLTSSPSILGNIAISPTDLIPWLDFFKIKSVVQIPKNMDLNAEFKFKSPLLEISSFTMNLKPYGYFEGNLKIDSINNFNQMNLQGIIQGKDIHIGTLEIPELKSTVRMKESILDFNPIEYRYAGGDHRGNFQIDCSTAMTKYRFSQESNHFELTTLFEALGYQNKVDGRTKLKFNLSSEGNTLHAFKQNLSGQGEFEVMNGKIVGIDAQSLLKHAQVTMKSLMHSVHSKKSLNFASVLKSELGQWEEQANQQENYSTYFTNIKGDFSLTASTITNNNLLINHPQFTIQGNGTLNLSDENLVYRLSGIYKDLVMFDPNDDMALFLNHTPLVVNIKGPIQEPGFKPELEAYLQYALKFSQRNMFEKFVDKTFDTLTDSE